MQWLINGNKLWNKGEYMFKDYYTREEVIEMLHMDKNSYAQLVNREIDPLPMRYLSWCKRQPLAERIELKEWFFRNSLNPIVRTKRNIEE